MASHKWWRIYLSLGFAGHEKLWFVQKEPDALWTDNEQEATRFTSSAEAQAAADLLNDTVLYKHRIGTKSASS